ncbi:hypothetical protein L210DRAFT_3362711, partial [Boletus edulis BED1]
HCNVFRINKAESPSCPHCLDWDETVTHLLLHCPHYTVYHNQLRHITRGKLRQIKWLLGDQKGIAHTLKFLHNTGR